MCERMLRNLSEISRHDDDAQKLKFLLLPHTTKSIYQTRCVCECPKIA